MIFKAGNGAQIIDKIMINEDEALREYPFINHALVIVKSEDDYLFGITNGEMIGKLLAAYWKQEKASENVLLGRQRKNLDYQM